MVTYFTFIENPESAIYKTQVIDVVNFFNNELNKEVKLFAIIPVKGFWKNRNKIKSLSHFRSVVYPQFPLPKMIFWKLNIFLLLIYLKFNKTEKIICRSIFASYMAIKSKLLHNKLKVVFDSRGIIIAEEEEYKIYPRSVSSTIGGIEKFCLQNSDSQMFITNEMVNFFEFRYKLKLKNYAIIPCTIGNNFQEFILNQEDIISTRMKYGYKSSDIIFVYSGSAANWQSFDLLEQFIELQLNKNSNYKFLLLTKLNIITKKIVENYPNNVNQMWVDSKEVPHLLSICDFGLILRNKSITNSVCSPTKFAEYLSLGLKVIISDTMAITKIVKDKEFGYIVSSDYNEEKFEVIDFDKKNEIKKESLAIYSKGSKVIKKKYDKILELC